MEPNPQRVAARYLAARAKRFTVFVQEGASDPQPAETVIEGESYHDGGSLWVLGKVIKTDDPKYRWAVGSWVLAIDGYVEAGSEERVPDAHLDFVETRRGDAAAMALTPMGR